MQDDTKWLRQEWQQKCLQAMRDTLDVNGDIKREMVQFLLDTGFWAPEKLDWDAAVVKFNTCLRPDSRENFSNLQLWALMKRFDRHAWFKAMADDLGYEIRRKPSDERRSEILERFVLALETNQRLLSELSADRDLLEAVGGSQHVHRALRQGPGNFSLPDDTAGPANV